MRAASRGSWAPLGAGAYTPPSAAYTQFFVQQGNPWYSGKLNSWLREPPASAAVVDDDDDDEEEEEEEAEAATEDADALILRSASTVRGNAPEVKAWRVTESTKTTATSGGRRAVAAGRAAPSLRARRRTRTRGTTR